MPKKPDEKPSQMVRIDARIYERVAAEAEQVGRTARQEIEHRLRNSFSKAERVETLELGSTSPAAAIGTLSALLTDECLEFGSSGSETLGMVQVALEAALNNWEPQQLSAEKKRLAEALANALVLKVLNVSAEDGPSQNYAQDFVEGAAARRQRAALLLKIYNGLDVLGRDKG